MKVIYMNEWLHQHYLNGNDKVSMEEMIRRSNYAKYGRRRW